MTLASTLLLLQSPLSAVAQEEQTAPPSGNVRIEQTSDIEAMGVWTLLKPNHESFERTDTTLDVPGLAPGQYSFFATPPQGTTTHIDLYLGDDVIKSSDTPQITFDIADKMSLRLVVKYSLTVFGKIGVSSEPPGMPFTLRGPDGFVEIGVTPVEFPKMPIGNYSVTYRPDGCPQPPDKAGLLQSEDRVDFNVQIVCKTFRPAEESTKPKTVSTQMNGKTVEFTDVPASAWFAPYVSTISNRKIMLGYVNSDGTPSGKFGPGDHVTLAQLAKVAHLLMRIDEQAVKGAPLNPLARGQWFTRYVASAEDRGWMVFADGSVDPNRAATRGEVVVTLLQALDIPMNWPTGESFTDVLRRTPYAGAIETLAAEGIVSGQMGGDGKPTGLFHPDSPITRAEIAKIVIGAYEKYLDPDLHPAPRDR